MTEIAEAELSALRDRIDAPLHGIIERAGALLAVHGTPGAKDLETIRSAAGRLLTMAAATGAPMEPVVSPSAVVAGTRPQELTAEAAAGPGKLLVVDDNASNRDMLTRRLERAGYAVAQCGHGLRALETVRRAGPGSTWSCSTS